MCVTSLTSASNQLKTVWEESTATLPIIVPALACWSGRVPGFQQVWEALSKISSKGEDQWPPDRDMSADV